MTASGDNKIAGNTAWLTGRTVLALLLSLLTTRILLGALGDSGYGLFNLVAGFAAFMAVLNNSAGAATMRFLCARMATGDAVGHRDTFAAALALHLCIAAAVPLLGLTVGLAVVLKCLVIAPGAQTAAITAFAAALWVAVCSVAEIPYIAAIMARERMKAYALVALSQAAMRLAIAMICSAAVAHGSYDAVIVYSLLYAAAETAVAALWIATARRQPETHTLPHMHARIVKSLLSFCGWDSLTATADMTRTQVMLIILNRLGGTLLNAAAAIALQVCSAIVQLGNAAVLSFRPRMVTYHSTGRHVRAYSLLCRASQAALLISAFVCVPLLPNVGSMLRVWLGQYPPHTIAFCRLAMIWACMQSLAAASATGIYADGRIRRAAIAGTLNRLIQLPLMWLWLRVGAEPKTVFFVAASFAAVEVAANILIYKYLQPAFPVVRYCLSGICRPLAVVALGAMAVALLPHAAAPADLIGIAAMSAAVMAAAAYFIILSAGRRRIILRAAANFSCKRL